MSDPVQSIDGPVPDRRTAVERLLGAFAKVEAGEGITVVLMFITIFLILSSYYVLKVVREGLIIGSGGIMGLSGAELKSYSAGAMAFLLIPVVRGYGTLASRVNRVKLLNISIGVVIGCLGLFYALGQLGVPLALPFFLWLGMVNVFLISQFYSYANDIYTEEQGKRLLAVIAIGGSLGAILGPKIAQLGKDYTFLLMVLAAAVLGICLFLYNVIDRRELRLRTGADTQEQPQEEAPLGKEGGFQLVITDRYLLLIALMLLIANLVNTTGEYILTTTVEQHAIETVPDARFAHIEDLEERALAIKEARRPIGNEFYGSFYGLVNLVGFLIQAFLVSRIFKYAGVRAALFVLPVIAFGGYLAIAWLGGLAVLRVAKTAENSVDYSLQNTVRQALFLPTSREAKYKAKAAIDTFFVRFGDAMSAALVAYGVRGLELGAKGFAFVNVGLVVVWLVIVVGIVRRHRKLSREEDVAGAAEADAA